MCNFQYGTMECRGDGYLWDADSDGWHPEDTDYACPQCNTLEYLKGVKEDAESVSSGSSNAVSYTGESLWMDAVGIATERNPEGVREALKAIKLVEALRPADNDEQYEVVRFVYN